MSEAADIGEDKPCFPMSASISEDEGDSARMGVTVIVIDDGLFLPSACFGLLACGGRMVTTDLVDLAETVEMEMLVSAIVGFEERDSDDDGERAEEREAVETVVVVGKSAGVGGSLGRGVYSIMAKARAAGGRWRQPETLVETCQFPEGSGAVFQARPSGIRSGRLCALYSVLAALLGRAYAMRGCH